MTSEPPIMPTADEADDGDRVAPPTMVTAAYWLWIVAGAIGLAGGVTAVQIQDTLVAGLVRLQGMPVPDAAEIVRGQTIFLISGSVVFLLLYWLLAHQARNGVRKARTLLVVVGVLGGLFQFLFAIRLFGALAVFLAMVALVLLYLGPARRFYDAHGR